MGVAIIKGEFGANALSRIIQNVTPKDSNRRKLFTSNDLRNVVWELQNGVYVVAYIDLGLATQHYKYVICDSNGDEITQPGVNIDLISGTIRLDVNYEGGAVYAKVLPITNQYYATAVSTPAVLVKEAEEITLDTYSLEVAYHGEQGLSAEVHSVVSLTSFVLKKNNVTTIANVTDMDAAVRAGTLTVTTSVITLGVSSWITVKDSRNLQLTKNTGSVRLAEVRVTCTYENETITDDFTVVLLANALETVDNDVTYSGSLVEGTSIVYTDISATGHYTNGDSTTIHPQLNGINPSVISEGSNTYTITFANNITKTITIVGQAAAVSKAYISGFPEDPYPTSNPIISADGSMVSIPLKVMVVEPGGTTATEKTFSEFLALSPRETYDAPVITFRGELLDYSIPLKQNGVGSDGTLNYDLTKDNYVYDKTRISSITLTCTSDSTKSCTYGSVSIDMHLIYSTYFTNADNFTPNDLINKPVISGSTTPTVASGVTILGGSGSNVGVHYSNTNSSTSNGLALSSSGYYYRLPQQDSYYLSVAGSSSYVAIISIVDDENNGLTGGSTYKMNTWGNNIKVLETSSSNLKYIHHTPDPNTKTYIVDLGNEYPLTWKLLIPKNNE